MENKPVVGERYRVERLSCDTHSLFDCYVGKIGVLVRTRGEEPKQRHGIDFGEGFLTWFHVSEIEEVSDGE